jgi:hypothetical protein
MTGTQRNLDMNSVKTLRMGFLNTDDRLLIDFVHADRTDTMQVTRRILRRIIHGLANILAQSSPVVARVPASHKSEMLAWEHLSALQPDGKGGDAGEESAPQPRPSQPWPLLAKLDINAQPTCFNLRFEDGAGTLVAMAMSRAELHRLLANLRQLARHAEWDLDTEIGWLVEADAPQMQPGNLAS